jgi:hypothetical protein
MDATVAGLIGAGAPRALHCGVAFPVCIGTVPWALPNPSGSPGPSALHRRAHLKRDHSLPTALRTSGRGQRGSFATSVSGVLWCAPRTIKAGVDGSTTMPKNAIRARLMASGHGDHQSSRTP